MPLSLPQTGYPTPQVLSTLNRDAVGGVGHSNAAGASAAMTAAVAYFYPIRIDQPRTYVKAWWLNGATAIGNVDVGVYTISGATATRVVASTAEAQGTISVMQVATTFTTTTLNPGLYYLAISSSGASTIFRGGAVANVNRTQGAYQAAASSPLPASCTVVAHATAAVWCFGLSEVAAI